jgi:hypothetical protein
LGRIGAAWPDAASQQTPGAQSTQSSGSSLEADLESFVILVWMLHLPF